MVSTVSPASRGARPPRTGRLVASILEAPFRRPEATLTAHLSTPAEAGIAGVGTFPVWLALAVAPASKGLIPQPVSMSDQQFRVPPGAAQALRAPAHAPRAARRRPHAWPTRCTILS